MGQIMIKCPTTGQDVPTGIGAASQENLDRNSFEGMTFSPCPACGGAHTWSKKDAFYKD